ncbi:oxalate decarboxylase [Lentinus brumalis]|uniref:Oxalate decarboxylase n=1 Tax=Lentinus brumalis TaxID=2498619 RepID=A0A371DD72_9APHY|nr:oxalate decarboxylase [Polyporus brumalis]
MLTFAARAIACAVLFATYAVAAPVCLSPGLVQRAASSDNHVAESRACGASPSSAVSSEFVSESPPTLFPSSQVVSAVTATVTVSFASDQQNGPLWTEDLDVDPQPIRHRLGASILGPQNVPVALQNPDLIAPPTTDSGNVPNAKWPFALSHNRLQTGGWARQQNVDVMPIAKSMAGVNMRLKAGAIRELHWHKTAEWAYVIKGGVHVTAINSDGQNFLGTANTGDLWYFPPGIPHSLQATNDDPDGAEFLLVFDDGAFSEDSTFLLTDWLAHVPKEVLAKNFKANLSAFDHIPAEQLYIFPSNPPPADSEARVTSPQSQVPSPLIFKMSGMNATRLDGGHVKVVDSTSFPVSTAISVAEVTVEPGAMRELHWHPTQDEWSYFLEGNGRATLFASSSNSRTFNYQAGDVGFVPASFGHYVENTSNTTLRFLEIINADRYQDISLNQWLALTPPDLVKAHLNLDDETISHFSKTKYVVVGPV